MQRALALKMFYVRAIPRSGYYSGASLGVRFIALLHYFFTLSVPAGIILRAKLQNNFHLCKYIKQILQNNAAEHIDGEKVLTDRYCIKEGSEVHFPCNLHIDDF